MLYVDVERKLLISGSWDARAVVWSIDKILQGSIEVIFIFCIFNFDINISLYNAL